VTEYDTFFLTDLKDVEQDTEYEMVIRDLTPGRAKYRCQYVNALVSSDPDRYPDRLWPRLGRGQWVGQPWSVKVVTPIEKIPAEWR
jgi:phenylphosphate carboxylase gamma subunit